MNSNRFPDSICVSFLKQKREVSGLNQWGFLHDYPLEAGGMSALLTGNAAVSAAFPYKSAGCRRHKSYAKSNHLNSTQTFPLSHLFQK
jgi:hypothetical protein